MNLIKRSFLFLVRKPTKSILLFLIVFFIGNFVGSSIAIKESVDLAKTNIKRGLGAYVSIHGKEDLLIKYQDKKIGNQDIETIFDEIVNDERIQYYDYGYYSFFESDNVTIRSVSEDSDRFGFNVYGITQNNFYDLNNDNISIVEGRNFTNEEIEKGANVIILNCNFVMYDKETDKLVKIEIGDKIHLNRVIYKGAINSFSSENNIVVYDEFSEYEVIGLYKTNKEIKNNIFWPSFQIDNTITYSSTLNEGGYIPLVSLKEDWEKTNEIKEKYAIDTLEWRYDIFPYFMNIDYFTIQLNDSEELQEFKKFCLGKFNDNQIFDIEIFTSDNSYDTVAGPLESLSSISSIILYISIIISIVIIGLAVMLVIRDRKPEMGLYMSLGEKKWKIISQMFFELYVIGMLAISLSIFTGNKIGEIIFDHSIKIENERNKEIIDEKLEVLGSVNPENLGLEDVSESVEFNIDSKYVVSIYIISTGVFVISILVPSIYILKMDPKEIML